MKPVLFYFLSFIHPPNWELSDQTCFSYSDEEIIRIYWFPGWLTIIWWYQLELNNKQLKSFWFHLKCFCDLTNDHVSWCAVNTLWMSESSIFFIKSSHWTTSSCFWALCRFNEKFSSFRRLFLKQLVSVGRYVLKFFLFVFHKMRF